MGGGKLEVNSHWEVYLFFFLNKKEPKLFPLLEEPLMSGNELVF